MNQDRLGMISVILTSMGFSSEDNGTTFYAEIINMVQACLSNGQDREEVYTVLQGEHNIFLEFLAARYFNHTKKEIESEITKAIGKRKTDSKNDSFFASLIDGVEGFKEGYYFGAFIIADYIFESQKKTVNESQDLEVTQGFDIEATTAQLLALVNGRQS